MNAAGIDRDTVLSKHLRKFLSQHPRLSRFRFELKVAGGVVHAAGRVHGREDCRVFRQLISRVRGVNAVWDNLLTEENKQPLQIIDLGCAGKKQLPQARGVDRYPFSGVDTVADLEQGLPFKTSSVDHVYAVHFLEHIRELLPLMNEIHRILRPDGVLHVMVPNAGSTNAVADPTHVRYFNAQTFKYFCQPRPGVSLFRPGLISSDKENIYADLCPAAAVTDEDIVYYFD